MTLHQASLTLRFLLADDPGAGKTIMAGLLIKELGVLEVTQRIGEIQKLTGQKRLLD